MNKYLLSFLIISMTIPAIADGHSNAEKKVIANVEAYWDARNSENWDMVVAMSSSSGMLNTNSDGSFHKPLKVTSVEQMKENFLTYSGLWKVYYPEAIALSKDVILTRYYLEGLSKAGASTTPYRTRVTHTWVNENGKWLTRSWHFSPATYGGVHVTQSSDFKKQ